MRKTISLSCSCYQLWHKHIWGEEQTPETGQIFLQHMRDEEMEMLRIFVLCLELSDTLHGHAHTLDENNCCHLNILWWPLLPDQSIPVDKKDKTGGRKRSKVLSCQVVRNLRIITNNWMSRTIKPTFHQGNFPIVATATVTAGLRWPPDTPPLTTIPSVTPIPQLCTISRQ